jgi:hypothetical protein
VYILDEVGDAMILGLSLLLPPPHPPPVLRRPGLDDGPKLGVAVMAFTMAMVFRADAVGATGGGSLSRVAVAGWTLTRCSTICPTTDNSFIYIYIGSL